MVKLRWSKLIYSIELSWSKAGLLGNELGIMQRFILGGTPGRPEATEATGEEEAGGEDSGHPSSGSDSIARIIPSSR